MLKVRIIIIIIVLLSIIIVTIHREHFPEFVSTESERVKIMGVIAGMVNGGMSCG